MLRRKKLNAISAAVSTNLNAWATYVYYKHVAYATRNMYIHFQILSKKVLSYVVLMPNFFKDVPMILKRDTLFTCSDLIIGLTRHTSLSVFEHSYWRIIQVMILFYNWRDMRDLPHNLNLDQGMD